ncbi:unnamed protein product, partial [Porites lobata]
FSSKAFNIGGIVALCLILLVTLAGNSLIVMLVYKTPNLRKPINYFIANMASSDLLFILFICHGILARLNISWIIGSQFGQAFCKLISFLPAVSSFVSIQNLILIAVDRFGAVVFPLRSPLIRSKLCPFFILATWIVALAVSSPYVFAAKLEQSSVMKPPDGMKHSGPFSSYQDFTIVIFILFICIPVLLLVILYSFIFIKLKEQVHPGEHSSNIEQQRQRRNRNVLYMSIAIISVFVFCWLPFITSKLILVYRSSSTHFSCSFSHDYHVTYYIAAAYFALNPIICFTFSSNYRLGLKRLINSSSGVQQ